MNIKKFIKSNQVPWEAVGNGVKRKILGFDKNLMMVKVDFEKGGIGSVHSHSHTQVTYIAFGSFEVEIDGEKQLLKQGDSFFVPSDITHGVVCLEKGELIDIFNPYREDFI